MPKKIKGAYKALAQGALYLKSAPVYKVFYVKRNRIIAYWIMIKNGYHVGGRLGISNANK